jgi:septal ring factor EnvC (AmiA/AmiB activator)
MNIEDVIKNNLEAFDESPSAVNWQKISAEIQTMAKPSIWISKRMRIFSGAAILISCLCLGFYLGLKSKTSQSYAENMPEMAQENAEFVMFTQNLEEKKAIFSKLVSDQPALEEAFAKDLDALDQDYQALKSQIQVSPNKEQILNAMIDNLKYQEQILNTQTRILEKTGKTQSNDIL